METTAPKKREGGRKAEMEGEMEEEGAKESMTGEKEWRTRREIWLPSYDDVMEIERAEKSKSQVIYSYVVQIQVDTQLGCVIKLWFIKASPQTWGEIRAKPSTSGSWSKERDWHRKRELAENAGAKGDGAEIDCKASSLRSRYHSRHIRPSITSVCPFIVWHWHPTTLLVCVCHESAAACSALIGKHFEG